jgi:hypothetical protein
MRIQEIVVIMKRRRLVVASVVILVLSALALMQFHATTVGEHGSNKSAESGASTIPDRLQVNGSGSQQDEPLKKHIAQVEQIHTLVTRFERGDLDATYDIYKYLKRCGDNPSAIETMKAHQKEQGMPDYYLRSLDALYKDCSELQNSIDSSLTINELGARLAAEDYYPYVAEQLYSISQALGLETADNIASKILESRDGEAIANLLPYLNNRDSIATEFADSDLARLRQDRNNALLLTACHFGREACNPGSLEMLNVCALEKIPNCFPNLGMVDYLIINSWSLAEQNRANNLYGEFINLISTGETEEIIKKGRGG